MNLNIFQKSKELAELQTNYKALVEKNELLAKDLKETQDTIGNFMVEKETFTKQMEDLKTSHASQLETIKNEYEAKIKDLTEKTVVAEASAGEEAIHLISSVGVAPETIKVTAQELNSNNVNKRFKVTTVS